MYIQAAIPPVCLGTVAVASAYTACVWPYLAEYLWYGNAARSLVLTDSLTQLILTDMFVRNAIFLR